MITIEIWPLERMYTDLSKFAAIHNTLFQIDQELIRGGWHIATPSNMLTKVCIRVLTLKHIEPVFDLKSKWDKYPNFLFEGKITYEIPLSECRQDLEAAMNTFRKIAMKAQKEKSALNR